jgi:hypothetical protein|tara:strand:+ start:8596 stop:9105 length:510 start_codon:yes stop_codon:yes gene_type:complete
MNEVKLNRGGLPETILPAEDSEILDGIEEALSSGSPSETNDPFIISQVINKLLKLVEAYPDSIAIWTQLGVLSPERMKGYAFFRLAYHRGLDALRKNGWRGSGFVRWEHPSNQSFLRALHGLQMLSKEIGDDEEAARCHHFLFQLEPRWESICPAIDAEPGSTSLIRFH